MTVLLNSLFQRLRGFYNYFANLRGFSILAIVSLICLSGFQWRANRFNLGAENKLLDSRFWYTPEDVQKFFECIDTIKINIDIVKTGLDLYAVTQVSLDLLFPIVYGTLFAVLIIFLYKARSFKRFKIQRVTLLKLTLTLPKEIVIPRFKLSHLILIPTLAIIGDFGENFITVFLAWSYPNVSSSLVWLASVFTLVKWVMVIGSLIIIFYGTIVWCIRNIDQIIIFWKHYIYYIFRLRVPIVSGLILFLFPILANTIASKLIQNIFVMQNLVQLVIVMVVSTIAALVVSYSFEGLFNGISDALRQDKKPSLGAISGYRIYYLFILLIFVNWSAVILLSFAELQKIYDIYDIYYVGIVGLFISLYLICLIETAGIRKAFEPLNCITWRLRLGLYIASALIYATFIKIYDPNPHKFFDFGEPSESLYIYLLIWLLTFFLSDLTFRLDKYSVPSIVLLILLSGVGYLIFNVDHYYKLTDIPNDEIKLSQIQTEEQKTKNFGNLETAFDNRLKNQLKNQPRANGRTLVIVTASGGGIQASGWTAQVLGGLQEELGTSFTQATGLISSVSGGSVGTMYFLDGFDDIGYPVGQNRDEKEKNSTDDNSLEFNNQALNTIFNNATEDWLDAVGWGIAYPDLMRLTGLGHKLVGKYNDRGYTLEDDWQKNMREPKHETTLEDWREKSIRGQIPISVFNATLVEDGRRFLISPLKFIEGSIEEFVDSKGDAKVLDFRTLYRGKDLNVTTAARLSATFPYVSPLPRNDQDISYDLPNGKKFLGNYHISDGGYFDNSGLFTAVELISKDLGYIDEEQTTNKKRNSIIQDLNIKRILLLEINASPQSKLEEGSKGARGWFMESIGPLTAAYAVRDSTQISRNLKEVELLKKLGKNQDIDIDIKSFTIFFPEGYKQPLSWRLTKQQIKNLKLAWQDFKESPTFKDLKKLWQDEWKIPRQWKE